MSILELQVEALMKLCTATDEAVRKEAREEIAFLLQKKPAAPAADPEARLRQILLELGAPDHLLGHDYVVEGILMVANDRTTLIILPLGCIPSWRPGSTPLPPGWSGPSAIWWR